MENVRYGTYEMHETYATYETCWLLYVKMIFIATLKWLYILLWHFGWFYYYFFFIFLFLVFSGFFSSFFYFTKLWWAENRCTNGYRGVGNDGNIWWILCGKGHLHEEEIEHRNELKTIGIVDLSKSTNIATMINLLLMASFLFISNLPFETILSWMPSFLIVQMSNYVHVMNLLNSNCISVEII